MAKLYMVMKEYKVSVRKAGRVITQTVCGSLADKRGLFMQVMKANGITRTHLWRLIEIN